MRDVKTLKQKLHLNNKKNHLKLYNIIKFNALTYLLSKYL